MESRSSSALEVESRLKEQREAADSVFQEFRNQAAARMRALKRKAKDNDAVKTITLRPRAHAEAGYPSTIPEELAAAKADLHLRRLVGDPEGDPPLTQCCLLAIAAGEGHMGLVNKTVQRFPASMFQVVIFHYDGKVDAWRETPWFDRAIHVGAVGQSKWWFARRFLHPEVVFPYGALRCLCPFFTPAIARPSMPLLESAEYIFLWDEDIAVTPAFDPSEYVKLARRHRLHISQPALHPNSTGASWPITTLQEGTNLTFHRGAPNANGQWCDSEAPAASQPPPCGQYAEIMAPVFTLSAWRCVWHLLPNGLVHGWGIDFWWKECAAEAGEGKPGEFMAIVDAQPVVHQGSATLGQQGSRRSVARTSDSPVELRRKKEWARYSRIFSQHLEEEEEEQGEGEQAGVDSLSP